MSADEQAAPTTDGGGPTPYHMTPDEYDEIRAEIWCEPWKAPGLFEDMTSYLVRRLGDLAMRPVEELEALCHPHPVIDDDAVSEWATDLLRECFDRAKSGVPFGEPWGDQPPPPEDL